jgi:long-chain acyl-CoA synthetase
VDVVPEDGLVGEAWDASIRVSRSGEPGAGAAEACAAGEAGHLWVHTPALMRGYLGRDDLTAQAVSDGWFTTGDIGLVDARGRLHLRGREREEINRGGAKVYPGDVDAVLERFDRTLDVCTFGYEDTASGEEVGVALVLQDGDADTLRRLHAWARRHLAAHQLPRRWYLVDTIARTARGKVNRTALAAQCAQLRPLDARDLGGRSTADPAPGANDGVGA